MKKPNAEIKNNNEKFITALQKGDLSSIKLIFSQTDVCINGELEKYNSLTTLMLAAARGHENIVKYLVEEKKASVPYIRAYPESLIFL